MSYDVDLICKSCNQIVRVEKHTEGGTHAMDGSKDASLNVTYNYSEHLNAALGCSLSDALHDKKAKDCIKILEKAVNSLGTKRSNDYWESTEGNAGHALNILLGWAKQHPNATFNVG